MPAHLALTAEKAAAIHARADATRAEDRGERFNRAETSTPRGTPAGVGGATPTSALR